MGNALTRRRVVIWRKVQQLVLPCLPPKPANDGVDSAADLTPLSDAATAPSAAAAVKLACSPNLYKTRVLLLLLRSRR